MFDVSQVGISMLQQSTVAAFETDYEKKVEHLFGFMWL